MSRVTVAHVSDQKRRTLQPRVREHVEPGSRVFTDALASYEGLGDNYLHDMVEHAKGEYVKDGDVHTNCMENFWALLKRALGGTYIKVTPKHLGAYCDEQVFRFNERHDNDLGRFLKALAGTVGRRLTYEGLVRP